MNFFTFSKKLRDEYQIYNTEKAEEEEGKEEEEKEREGDLSCPRG